MLAAIGLVVFPDWVDLYGFRATNPSLSHALVSMFLHENMLHLMGNMVFLASVGSLVEMTLGPIKFVIVYLAGGIAGAYLHAAIYGRLGDSNPMIGASGAIAACVGYVAVRYINRRVEFLPKVSAQVGSVVLLWLGLQVLGAFVRIGQTKSGGVAFLDHLGGLAAGLTFGLFFKAHSEVAFETTATSMRAMEERSPAALLQAVRQHLQHHPDDLAARLAEARALRALGEHDQEGSVLADVLPSLELEAQIQTVSRLAELGDLGKVPSLRRTILAERLRGSAPESARLLLESVIASPEDANRPDALLSLATISMAESPEEARRLIVELFARYPLHPAADLARSIGLSG